MGIYEIQCKTVDLPLGDTTKTSPRWVINPVTPKKIDYNYVVAPSDPKPLLTNTGLPDINSYYLLDGF